jgi:hypothetical protein
MASVHPLQYSKVIRPFQTELGFELLVCYDAISDQELE